MGNKGFDVVTPQPEHSRPGDVGSAKKMDAGKAPIWQGFFKYFPNAVFAVAMVSEYGDRKYVDPNGPADAHYTDNWCKLPNGFNRYFDGQLRHALKIPIEGYYDDGDSGLAHLAQDAWNALAKLERAIRDGTVQIRRGNDIVNGKPVLGTAYAVKP